MEDEYDVQLEGPLTKRHLMALIFEFKNIKIHEADRKLKVGSYQINLWCKQLKSEGLVEYSPEEGDDAELILTKSGLKILKQLEKDWIEQEGIEPEPIKLKVESKQFKSLAGNLRPRLSQSAIEFLVFGSVIFSLYLIQAFVKNPNVEGASFVFGALTLSFSIILYNRYRKQMKAAQKMQAFFPWLKEHALSVHKTLELFLIFLLSVYSFGMLFLYIGGTVNLTPMQLNFFIVLSVLVASSAELVYYPKKTLRIIAHFYLGIILMLMGLLIIFGLIDLTMLLFGNSNRFVDLIFGIGSIILAYINDKKFGISKVIDHKIQRKEPDETEEKRFVSIQDNK